MNNYKHGHSSSSRRSKEYRTYHHMIQRCTNPNVNDYSHYGGRGIRVCSHWMDSFENFLLDMGLAPSVNHSIDRIDNNGNYKLSNCRWATPKEQANNRRLRYDAIVVDGMSLRAYCLKYRLNYSTIKNRIQRYNWPIERAISTPVRKKVFGE